MLLALDLNDAIDYLSMKLMDKEWQVKDIIKSGRTHLMDAVPLSLGYEIQTWKETLIHCNQPLLQSAEELQYLPIGGTAIGTGLNAPKNFGKSVCLELNKIYKGSGAKFSPNPNKSEMISSQNHILSMSGALLRTASCLTKICNDLRWMNSGPVSGLSEITLKALQPERVTGKQIEAARVALTRHMKRQGRVWTRVFPNIPVSKKPIEVRMGKGKGNPEFFACRVKPGRILFEVDGVSEQIAKEALYKASAKLPIKTKTIKRFA